MTSPKKPPEKPKKSNKNRLKSVKPRFITPPNRLKQKVGTGGIDKKLLDDGQKALDEVDVDFRPYADKFVKQLSKEIDKFGTPECDPNTLRERIANPFMELKANAGMFKYKLVSDVAAVALQFIDCLNVINKDALEVVRAHEDTLKVIVTNNLKGDGGREGDALIGELDRACKRYFTKHTD